MNFYDFALTYKDFFQCMYVHAEIACAGKTRQLRFATVCDLMITKETKLCGTDCVHCGSGRQI